MAAYDWLAGERIGLEDTINGPKIDRAQMIIERTPRALLPIGLVVVPLLGVCLFAWTFVTDILPEILGRTEREHRELGRGEPSWK